MVYLLVTSYIASYACIASYIAISVFILYYNWLCSPHFDWSHLKSRKQIYVYNSTRKELLLLFLSIMDLLYKQQKCSNLMKVITNSNELLAIATM